MKPGRELDALIAEKVFGFSAESISGIGQTWSRKNDSDGFYLQPYSTSIEAAWEVVEKMFKLGWNMELNLSVSDDSRAHVSVYRVDFRKFINQEAWVTEFSQSAPHAICLAALKTMESSTEVTGN
jgi:hypothetical protein